MRVAVIGTGRTGSEVVKQLGVSRVHATFDRSSPPKTEQLKGADIAIVFTPGNSVLDIAGVLLEARLPAVWGSTGFEWPPELLEKVVNKGLCWIQGTNFSLGMAVVQQLLTYFGQLTTLLQEPSFHLIETHHTGKVDSPSGTALSWENWFGHPLEMTSIREGDVVGNHLLEVETPNERIYLEHQAKSRAIFAEGAIWSAEKIVTGAFSSSGLHLFENVVKKSFQGGFECLH